MSNRLRYLALVVATLISGCVTTQPGENGSTLVKVSLADALGIKSAQPPAKPTPTVQKVAVPQQPPAVAAPSIKTTALAGIFTKFPFDGTSKSYFPHVAVTVTDWSRSDCWTAVAKIWSTKSKSESVPPFSVCWGNSLGFALNNAANLHLFMQQTALEHTGNLRTDGPKAPMIAVPNKTPGVGQQESFTGFIQQLAVDTGWQAGAPTNIWIVDFVRSNDLTSTTKQLNGAAPMSTPVVEKVDGASQADTGNEVCGSSEWSKVANASSQKGVKVTSDGDGYGASYKLKTPVTLFNHATSDLYIFSEGGQATYEAIFRAKSEAEKGILLQEIAQAANLKSVGKKNEFSRQTNNGRIDAGLDKKGRGVFIICDIS